MSSTILMSTRLPRLAPSHMARIRLMLDNGDMWRNLAAEIKDRNGHDMFSNDQIACISRKPSPTQAVMESWFADNPSVADLLEKLIDIRLYRAADYVNMEILKNEKPVTRPGDERRSAVGLETVTSSPPVTSHGDEAQGLHGPPDTSANTVSSTCSCYSRIHEDPTSHLILDEGVRRFSLTFLCEATGHFDDSPVENGGHFLGEGGFAKVYKGVHQDYPAMAVKRLINMTDLPPGTQRQLSNELTVLARCDHENILRVIGYSDEGSCLVYELMENGSLEDRLACKNDTAVLSLPLRLSILQGAARGIVYLHRLTPPLIHRDIKSANILLDRSFQAKIGDCGTVRQGPAANRTSTRAQQVIGTNGYMPMEYLQDGAVSEKLDAYSYGVTLHIEDEVDEDEDFLRCLDARLSSWNPQLALQMYSTATLLLEDKKKKRRTISEVLDTIESWKDDRDESVC